MSLAILLAVTLAASWLLTARVVVWARAANVIDVPNARSSHSRPTPRGGGIGIVITSLVAIVFLAAVGKLPWNVAGALLSGGALVALAGAIDDRFGLHPGARLIAHMAAGILVISFLGGMPPIDFGFLSLQRGLAADAVGVLGLVWLINLTNFMDGIDGIAASEAACVLYGAGILLDFTGAPGLAWTSAVIATATIGFLIHNWPPASVFMGDVSSGFLGLAIGTLMLAHAARSPHALWTWLILFAAFVVDATVTLLRRAARRKRVYEAHCSHAYQHAARKWGHRTVTSTVIAINVVWLAPCALASYWYPDLAAVLFAAAVVPLIVLAFSMRAGIA